MPIKVILQKCLYNPTKGEFGGAFPFRKRSSCFQVESRPASSRSPAKREQKKLQALRHSMSDTPQEAALCSLTWAGGLLQDAICNVRQRVAPGITDAVHMRAPAHGSRDREDASRHLLTMGSQQRHNTSGLENGRRPRGPTSVDRWKSHAGSFLSAHHRDDRAGSHLQPPWRVEGAPGGPGATLTQTSIDPIGEHHGQQANTLPAATHVTSLLKKSRSDTYMVSSPTALRSPAQRREGQAWHVGGFQPAWGWHGERGLVGEMRSGGQQLPARGQGPGHSVDTLGSCQQTQGNWGR